MASWASALPNPGLTQPWLPGIIISMAMTYRPPDDLAEELRTVAFLTRRSANEILTEALLDWMQAKGRQAAQTAKDERKAKR